MTIKNKFAPNGISFLQLKKYAKKLQKLNSLTHQEALDQITKEKTSFQNWDQLNNYCNSKGKSIGKFQTKEESIVIYGKKNCIWYNNTHLIGAGNRNTFSFVFLNKNKNIGICDVKRILTEQNEITFSSLKEHEKSIISPTFYTLNSDHKNIINNLKHLEVIYIMNVEFANVKLIESIIVAAQKLGVIVVLIAESFSKPKKELISIALNYCCLLFPTQEPLKNDFKTLYNSKIFSDINLNIPTTVYRHNIS